MPESQEAIYFKISIVYSETSSELYAPNQSPQSTAADTGHYAINFFYMGHEIKLRTTPIQLEFPVKTDILSRYQTAFKVKDRHGAVRSNH